MKGTYSTNMNNTRNERSIFKKYTQPEEIKATYSTSINQRK
jgi:hypothetical protein